MRYLMRQKMFALADGFTIKDENDNDIYRVDGKVFAMGHKLSFNDMAGNELASISQKLLSWGPTYEIYQGGALTATVSKHFTFLKAEFTITVPGSDDLEAVGQFNAHAYTFTQAGRTVAEVSKRWFALTDTYGVDIAENEDDLLILAGTVVIDMVCHPDQQQNQL